MKQTQKKKRQKKGSRFVAALDWTILPISEIKMAGKFFVILLGVVKYYTSIVVGAVYSVFNQQKRPHSQPPIGFMEGVRKFHDNHLFFEQLTSEEREEISLLPQASLTKLRFSLFVCYIALIGGFVFIGMGIFSGISLLPFLLMFFLFFSFLGYCWVKQVMFNKIMYSRETLLMNKGVRKT